MIELGLTGFPLAHSYSPRIHQAALAYCHLKGEYTLFPVEPEDEQGLKSLLDRVRSGELSGLNVTIPHKQRVIALLDDLSTSARAIGAVNTISMQTGKLTGDNTDAAGFLKDLEHLLTDRISFTQKIAMVLGAGGAARAVVWALADQGWQIKLAARRETQARALMAQFPNHADQLTYIKYMPEVMAANAAGVRLIVNATPLGMSPDIARSPWPQDVPIPQGAACYDLVYNPRETAFVRTARRAGNPAANGLGMLVAQAALAFRIWTGEQVPFEHLMAAVEDL